MRAVDLFAGCGGLSKGLENAGFELALAVEKWESARAVYAKNFDHPVRAMDLSHLIDACAGVKKERPEIIVGGPPCQDFSIAGDRVERDRARLTVTYAEIVRAVRPLWFLMENVQAAQTSESWKTARRLLSGAGYGVTECVLNAADYGVPQHRKRLFAIGRLEEDDGFLLDELKESEEAEQVTVRQFAGEDFDVDFYYRHPRNWGRRAVYSVDELSPTIRSTNRPVPKGYKSHPDDAGPARRAKPLTPEQRARIQTFDRSFSFFGTATDKDLMIANAVPVLLAERVGQAIRRFEEKRNVNAGDRTFKNWLSETQGYTTRTTGNVVCRLRRAARILKVARLPHEPLEVIQALERRREFSELTPAVKSQLKQAVKLHAEFRAAVL